jgi:hypothetical protein
MVPGIDREQARDVYSYVVKSLVAVIPRKVRSGQRHISGPGGNPPEVAVEVLDVFWGIEGEEMREALKGHPAKGKDPFGTCTLELPKEMVFAVSGSSFSRVIIFSVSLRRALNGRA